MACQDIIVYTPKVVVSEKTYIVDANVLIPCKQDML